MHRTKEEISKLKSNLSDAQHAVGQATPVMPGFWHGRSHWDDLGYEVVTTKHAESAEYRYGSHGKYTCEYSSYHAAHVRLKPRIWAKIVRRLPPDLHHLAGYTPDQAMVAVVHDLLLERGDEETARRLKPALVTEEDYGKDMRAYRQQVRRHAKLKQVLAEAQNQYDSYWRPILERRRAKARLKERVACLSGEEQYLCTVPDGLEWENRAMLVEYLVGRGKADLIPLLSHGTLRTEPCRTEGRKKLLLAGRDNRPGRD